jgi:Icc-related predicted phosphoesterase
MRIVCISDTHGMHGQVEVPEGDVLIHAGDLSSRGTEREVAAFAAWFAEQPHRHKLVIAGNHDFLFEASPGLAGALMDRPGVTYLQDRAVEIEGVRFWGAPWQPWFHDWAFNLARGPELERVWAAIPPETQVLVTHGPPFGVLDVVERNGEHVGCEALRDRMEDLDVGLHVFGHIHEAYGVQKDPAGRLSVNASIATLSYEPTQAPVVIDWRVKEGRGTIVEG